LLTPTHEVGLVKQDTSHLKESHLLFVSKFQIENPKTTLTLSFLKSEYLLPEHFPMAGRVDTFEDSLMIRLN